MSYLRHSLFFLLASLGCWFFGWWFSPNVQAQEALTPTESQESRPASSSQPTNPAADTAEPATQQTSEPDRLYVRVNKNESGQPIALQTATVRYEAKPGSPHAGVVVDLVGVVHIGQVEYYEKLDQQLGTYDVVLYELVAPDGTRIRPEDLEKRRSLLASVQTGMKDMLNLQYQLEKIDYLSENFRHADMSPDEFAEDLERRGDSVWKMIARMMGAGVATQAQTGNDVSLLMALFSKDRSKLMKRAMAQQLVDIEMVTAGMDDANGENTLIKGRNRKAFEVLQQELEAGKKKIAVFYGAGHLPDMAKRLESDFDMTAVQTQWLDAWDLTRN